MRGATVVVSRAGDLYVAELPSGAVRRLTALPGRELFPKLSPDALWVAFTGDASGTAQVYVVPTAGGEPRALTSGAARSATYPDKSAFDRRVVGWTPDGTRVLFRSIAGSPTPGGRIFSVGLDGDDPSALPLEPVGGLSYSPDGKSAVFTRIARAFNLHGAWRGYRGGMAQDLWRWEVASGRTARIASTLFDEQEPLWAGDRIYFVREEESAANLVELDPATGRTERLTDFGDWDARFPSGDEHTIVFEQAGEAWKFDRATRIVGRLNLAFGPAAEPELRFDRADWLESASPSPDGRTIALVARGDLRLLDAANGEARHTEVAPASRERDPAFSPDGGSVAFVTDRTGDERLALLDLTNGRLRLSPTVVGAPLRAPRFAPNGRLLVAHDLRRRLWLFDRDRLEGRVIASSGERPLVGAVFTPDSEALVVPDWISADRSRLVRIELATGRSTPLDGAPLSEWSPRFAPDGGSLVSLCRTTLEPLLGRFELDPIVIDVDRICRRTVASGAIGSPSALPIARGALSELAVAADGAIIYRRSSDRDDEAPSRFERLAAGADEPVLIGERLRAAVPLASGELWVRRGSRAARHPADDLPIGDERGAWLDLGGDETHAAHDEWRQMVRESWRWQAALSYRALEPNWVADRLDATLALVPRLERRDDLNDLLAQSIAPIGLGHLFAAGGDLEITGEPEELSIEEERERWIAATRRRLTEASAGRIGYVRISNFAESGYGDFLRQWLDASTRGAVVIDARGADGGYLAEAVLERLARRPVGRNLCASCGRWTYPKGAYAGRLVLLVDEQSSSDGDLFAQFFRAMGLGPIVGRRTWGGVVGSHALDLVDGGEVGAADNAVTNLALEPIAENRGIEPDHDVEQPPGARAAGADPQLERALELLAASFHSPSENP